MNNFNQESLENLIRECRNIQDWAENSSAQLLKLYLELINSIQNQEFLLAEMDKESLRSELIGLELQRHLKSE